MKIYKISQDINDNWDTYDSAIVCAENEEAARQIDPSGRDFIRDRYFADWIPLEELENVKVEYIGEADEKIKKGVILASFNAG